MASWTFTPDATISRTCTHPRLHTRARKKQRKGLTDIYLVCSNTLTCTSSCRIPASASTYRGIETGDSIPLLEFVQGPGRGSQRARRQRVARGLGPYGSPQGPGHRPTVGWQGGLVSYERGTPTDVEEVPGARGDDERRVVFVGREIVAPRPDRTTRIPSGVASPLTTNQQKGPCVST